MADHGCPWEKISKFVSQRELGHFLTWMQDQISEGIAIEIEAPPEQQVIGGERWFRHVASGAMWRLVPADGPVVPGFWPIEN
jgi:hypothetical protein